MEVDFIVELGGRLVPIEVKLSATPQPPMATGIRAFQKDLGSQAGAGNVVHPGDVRLPLGPRVRALPFAELGDGPRSESSSTALGRLSRLARSCWGAYSIAADIGHRVERALDVSIRSSAAGSPA